MATRYHNLVGTTARTIELLPPNSKVGSINSITISNASQTDSSTVSLFIQDDPSSSAKSTFYLFRNIVIRFGEYVRNIPTGATLLLDNSSMLNFDKATYGLYIRANATDALLDILINS